MASLGRYHDQKHLSWSYCLVLHLTEPNVQLAPLHIVLLTLHCGTFSVGSPYTHDLIGLLQWNSSSPIWYENKPPDQVSYIPWIYLDNLIWISHSLWGRVSVSRGVGWDGGWFNRNSPYSVHLYTEYWNFSWPCTKCDNIVWDFNCMYKMIIWS